MIYSYISSLILMLICSLHIYADSSVKPLIFPVSEGTVLPLVSSSLSTVDLAYFKDFSYPDAQSIPHVHGCFLLKESVHNHSKGVLLRCREHMRLLHSSKQIILWRREEKCRGFISLQSGNHYIKAHIVSLKSHLSLNDDTHYLQTSTTGMVTGVFISHVVSANTYTVKNRQTGLTSLIHVTPLHRFYVVNRHAFIPIKNIVSTDILEDSEGRSMQLICDTDRKNNCGTSYNTGIPTEVFNMEVHGRHTYFVSGANVLVHNMCNDGKTKSVEKGNIAISMPEEHMESAGTIKDCISQENIQADTAFYLVVKDNPHSTIMTGKIEDSSAYSPESFFGYYYTRDNVDMKSPISRQQVLGIADYYGKRLELSDMPALHYEYLRRGHITDIGPGINVANSLYGRPASLPFPLIGKFCTLLLAGIPTLYFHSGVNAVGQFPSASMLLSGHILDEGDLVEHSYMLHAFMDEVISFLFTLAIT